MKIANNYTLQPRWSEKRLGIHDALNLEKDGLHHSKSSNAVSQEKNSEATVSTGRKKSCRLSLVIITLPHKHM